MKKTVRQFLKDMTVEQAKSLLGHESKRQVAKWLAHGQLPFKAADKIAEAMFFEELQTTGLAVVEPQAVEEAPPEPPAPQFTAEELRVMELEQQLADARERLANPTSSEPPKKLTWADVAAAGAKQPVVAGSAVEKTQEIAPGVLEIDPSEQSHQSMVLPGRVKAATNLPPRPAAKAQGPVNITAQNQRQQTKQVPVQPSGPTIVAPQNKVGWVKGPTTPTAVKGWTTPHPLPKKANG